ncbi:glycoside hydrolase family 13 protein [Roseateles sp. SL47]|uniref:glycoside hydrolase family 13 protein n=1 Tax=Roseateles sp. SL47 TaxID=2995138 RepID=UPI00226E27AB|nr:glycoside hydrolase family 13 protein [Roseateles sp. SL47]WAC75424.1 glycoside hydrolase family 13 protein [Roseateles sp. SL47]
MTNSPPATPHANGPHPDSPTEAWGPFTLERVEPPHWWVGMARPTLQLLLHGRGMAALQATLAPAPGVRLVQSQVGDSPHYLFLDLEIDTDAPATELTLELRQGERVVLTHRYALRARQPGSRDRKGFGPADAIYLVVPDRFSKGDPTHDAVPGMTEGVRRHDPDGRHGGDLAGLRQHLPYIAGMGFTMVWPTPLVENNSPRYSYHGYAATDFYRIDPRFGTHEDFRQLVKDAAALGLGWIQDIVLNHIGIDHWWMKDLPTQDWIHQWSEYTETHHARMSLQDPYAAPSDRQRFSDGWFTRTMPDLNQRQPLLATYLTQMTLWWIEDTGLAGIRTDTYSYSDRDFLTAWSARLREEYPQLNIVGEEWSPHPAVVAYWQAGRRNPDGYVSSLPSLMDFPLYGALLAGLTETDTHDGGLMRLYETLAHDFVYPRPDQLVLFEGNHDTPRLFSLLHEDLALTRMAWTWLAFIRRIPQFLYGTEVLLTSPRHRDDGAVRADFPGGWPGDTVNAVTGQGLSGPQREAQSFLRQLLQWRKQERLVHEGGLMQYAPLDGCHVLFRHAPGDTTGLQRRLMLVMNKRAEPQRLALSRFHDMVRPGDAAQEVLTGRRFTLHKELEVPGTTALLLEVS